MSTSNKQNPTVHGGGIKMTPSAIAAQLEFLAGRLRNGCHNHGCQIKAPTGQATNGPCQCSPRNFASQLMGLALECEQNGTRWEKR